MDLGPTAPAGAGISSARFRANLTAMVCPSAHAIAVPVDDLTGELVAWLCPDCDEQLPADWRPLPPALPPFEPDPQLTSRIKE